MYFGFMARKNRHTAATVPFFFQIERGGAEKSHHRREKFHLLFHISFISPQYSYGRWSTAVGRGISYYPVAERYFLHLSYERRWN